MMNVKKLRQLLEGVPDDVMVVTPGHDHSYIPVCSAGQNLAEHWEKYRHYSEYHEGMEYEENDAPDEIIEVFVIG